MARHKRAQTCEAIASNLRELGYPDVTGAMIEEIRTAMERGEALPHGMVWRYAKDQIVEANKRGLMDA